MQCSATLVAEWRDARNKTFKKKQNKDISFEFNFFLNRGITILMLDYVSLSHKINALEFNSAVSLL